MAADSSILHKLENASRSDIVRRSDIPLLRGFVIAAGMVWSILFVVVGLGAGLQMYGDGAMFSYAIAVDDAWAFYWHNFSGRLSVYLFADVPAETYAALTGNARGAIIFYGFLFFAAPFSGLVATFVADRSKGRIVFCFACASTACLCPLVFGFPTEMWMAHALFWPALALCHSARRGLVGTAAIFAVLLALVFTHEGAVIFAAAIVTTLLLRGARDIAFLRALAVFLVVMTIWGIVKTAFPPEDYVAPVLARAAAHVFDLDILTSSLSLLLLGTLASYSIVFVALRRLSPAKAHIYAAAIVAAALAAYWLRFDRALHADNRYYMRSVALVATPLLGMLAAACTLQAAGRLNLRVPLLPRLMAALATGVPARGLIGAFLLVTLVHAVETAKFVDAWSQYKAAVRALAIGTESDPDLGDARLVSSDRIGADLNRLSWFSTTHFLSVLVAPDFAPARLVVYPPANYFWLSCAAAKASEEADNAIPVATRHLVQIYVCLHR